MKTKYDGICFVCGEKVKSGNGDIQSKGSIPKEYRKLFYGKWLIRCFECKGAGNVPNKKFLTKTP